MKAAYKADTIDNLKQGMKKAIRKLNKAEMHKLAEQICSYKVRSLELYEEETYDLLSMPRYSILNALTFGLL